MTHKEFTEISSTIPVQPGIYKYYNAANELIYVGKAKHLRKRVGSYFMPSRRQTAEPLPTATSLPLTAAEPDSGLTVRLYEEFGHDRAVAGSSPSSLAAAQQVSDALQ